jgi:small subunit ribosomal protein S13
MELPTRGHAKSRTTMARILGIEIPNEKRIEASLPYMFGIGRPTAAKILEHAGIDPNIRTGQLSEEQLVRISQVIQTEAVLVEGDLRRERQAQLKRLTSINCYRGIRHKRGLAGPRPAHPHQCAYSQGQEENRGREEVIY